MLALIPIIGPVVAILIGVPATSWSVLTPFGALLLAAIF